MCCTVQPSSPAAASSSAWSTIRSKARRVVRTTLREKSVEVSYRDPTDNAQKTMRVGPDTLAALARMYAYMPETGALLPLGISRAVSGDYAPLAGQAQMLGQQMKSLADNAMQLSVICSEDADHIAVHDADQGTLLGSRFADVLKVQCEIWPHGTRPVDFNAPLAGDVPVLILGGEFDPVTPPRYGEQLVKNFSNARLIFAKGQGHNVIGRGCIPKLVGDFVDKLDPKTLDVKCVDRLGPMPAFVNFNGAAP